MGDLYQVGRKAAWYWLALMLLGPLFVLAADATAETGCRAIDGDTLQCGRERIRV